MIGWLLGLGCALRSGGGPEDPMEAALAAADRAWAARAEPDGLARALAAYEALLSSENDPRLYARIARAHHHAGLVAADPAAALAGYEAAREVAVRCLAEDPEVAALLPSFGYRWTPEVVVRIEADRMGCLIWAAAASVGTVEVRGPGALLELEGSAALRDRALSLDPEDPWALRTVAAAVLLNPQSDAEARAGAVDRLRQAVTGLPGFLLFEQDLAEATGAPFDPGLKNGDDPYRLENDAVRSRRTANSSGGS